MLRFEWCGLVLVLLSMHFYLGECGYGKIIADINATDITVVDDSNRFQSLNPSVILKKFEKIKTVKGTISYSMGARIPGDRLLVECYDKLSFPSARDVQVLVRYPAKGNASTITRIEMLVSQTSDFGDSFTADGGVDKKFATVLVEANSTYQFAYTASFFGY